MTGEKYFTIIYIIILILKITKKKKNKWEEYLCQKNRETDLSISKCLKNPMIKFFCCRETYKTMEKKRN